MKNSMSSLLVAAGAMVLVSAGAVLGAAQQNSSTFRIFPYYENFEWKESYKGHQLLKESGPIYGIGFDANVPLGNTLALQFGGSGFGGEVDYDGGIQNTDGTTTPYKSQTSYVGAEGNLQLGVKIPLGTSATLKPAGGLGFRAWERELDKSSFAGMPGQYGYTEDWFALHLIGGGTLEMSLGGSASSYIEADARLPIWTVQLIDLSNIGGPSSVDLNPKAQVTYHVEGGIRVGVFFAAVFHENLDFKASDTDSSGNFFQPVSKATMNGIKAGFSF